jgi:hypothetical protein
MFTLPLTQNPPKELSYCPLEFTDYENLCKLPHHNIELRKSKPCPHSQSCFNLRAELNSQNLL